MSTSAGDAITYPPAAHAPASRTSNEVVINQPGASPTMSTITPAHKGEAQAKPERLRGGCIPCPDGGMCFVIPCCC